MKMMIKKFIAVLCLTQLASSVPYQYSGYTTMSSSPAYLLKQSINGNSPAKFNVGYKVQEKGTTKVKKEFDNSEYQNYIAPDSVQGPYSSREFTSFEDGYSTPAAPLPQYPFPEQLKIAYIPNVYPTKPPQQPEYPPATVSNKILHPIHPDKPHQLVHNLVGHYITDVAATKLKHVGETLESGVLNEPIIHKLSLAKVALLQLLAILGPLSAIKTIHFVAKASDPHSHEPEHVENNYIAPVPLPLPTPVPLPAEFVEYGPPHYPHTLVGMILNFVAQLSKFNKEAKLHLIPNLLKVVSRTSSSSAHVSGHIPE